MGGQISWFSLLTFYLFTISRIINGIIFQQQKIGGGLRPGHIVPEFSLGLCFIYIYTPPAPYFLQCCCHSVTLLQFLHQYTLIHKIERPTCTWVVRPSSQITTRYSPSTFYSYKVLMLPHFKKLFIKHNLSQSII